MSKRKIEIEIDCGDEDCGKCPEQGWGQFDNRECLFGPLTANYWCDLKSIKETAKACRELKRLPECLAAERTPSVEGGQVILNILRSEYLYAESKGNLMPGLVIAINKLEQLLAKSEGDS
jgi:hypothetical protein